MRLTQDHQLVMQQLQSVQLASVAVLEDSMKTVHKETEEIEKDSRPVFNPSEEATKDPPLQSNSHQQILLTEQSQLDPFQQSILEERERGIREIQESMTQVAELFRDIGTLTTEQTGLLDHIEAGLEGSAGRTRAAVRELTINRENRRRRSWTRVICSGILILVVGLFVLGIIHSF